MRIWDVSPGYLNRQSLLGEHRELHGLVSILVHGKRGYSRHPETVRWAARRGAQVVFHPHFHEASADSYRPATFADPANTFHEKALLCRAAENTCYIAAVNCASPGSPTTSVVVNPDGTVRAWQPYGEAGLLVVDIDLDEATGELAKRLRV